MQATMMQPCEVRLVRRPGTRRQRRARTLKALAVILLVVLFMFVAPRVVEMLSPADAPVLATHTVGYGDSLWAIAEQYNQGGDVRDAIIAIKRVNHLTSATVHPGQELVIPKLGGGK
ncbi:MAG TPA: LysM peptidoglycan-binding domain-containing protein [Symbiobacteriaceae bacterium]|jgi:nucleoid-associated protein YgaU|nr:LysM peptidoglycan-binding domain-containing protein [Symbiobacteriaceae bacterium]